MDVEKSILKLIIAAGVNPCRSLTGLCIELHLSAGSWTVSKAVKSGDLRNGLADDRQTVPACGAHTPESCGLTGGSPGLPNGKRDVDEHATKMSEDE